MVPRITPGSLVVVDKVSVRVRGVRVGEIVVLVSDSRWLIKRVKSVSERHGAEMVYVVGDNEGNSFDSRMFGAVPVRGVIGRVVCSVRRSWRW